jgi:ribose/xylose/arabinose/galactoside ABC-type transport system permease subunit
MLYVVFTSTANGFLSFNNQINILRDAATIGIAAWAATLIIIAGEIDVSVGPMVAFISVVLAFCCNGEFRHRSLSRFAIVVGAARIHRRHACALISMFRPSSGRSVFGAPFAARRCSSRMRCRCRSVATTR